MTAPLSDATLRQQEAAQPMQSTWLSANAGSGKTRVLTDRVARLLLEDVEPQHILCLTYTKAAASEMQNRLFQRLGAWAMLDDDTLRAELAELGLTDIPTTDGLRHARTLFARAIETPGGLKIQTIHSFCASLLRRFPLEAGVSPQFTEIEDRAADLLRAELVDQIADGPDADVLAGIARQYKGEDFLSLTREIVGSSGYREMSLGDALELFGHPRDMTRDRLVEMTFAPGDWQMLQDLLPILAGQGVTDKAVGEILKDLIALDDTSLSIAEAAFLTQSGTRKKRFPTKATQTQAAHLLPALEALIERVETAREARLALESAEHTVALHRFACRFSDLYQEAKKRRGWLDFDDLIQKAQQLLSDDRVAAWVLYRLDGGIDHILVDEAQDTSPLQWDVIRRLAEEFSSGEGARADVTRTIFVVGDKKQSIYSFQGADPREFDRMQAEFGSKLAKSGQNLWDRSLDFSFRSSPAILNMVDKVFEDDADAGFASGSHIAFNTDLPGRVDLWPLVPKPEKTPERDWFDPVDRRSPEHQFRTLAMAVAGQIKQMLDDKVPIPDKDGARALQPRDFLILVQRRGGIFPNIIRACKELNLPIAGADRLKVGAETAVRDLAALLSFLATPEDSLSLATALRSPLFGWSEQDLFTLAHHREEDELWRALRTKTDDHPETVAVLRDLRNNVDFLRPYDLIERVLTRHRGRQRMLARLGSEAEDGINALLSQALSYERNEVPSLTGFLTWMETDDLEVKRQIDSASNQIRVMTVHGSKGLEAPVVILPECGKREIQIRDAIVEVDQTPVWKMPSGQLPERLSSRLDEMKTAQREESLRLLYVALTRAEKWLIVGAAGELSKDGSDWHQRVQAGMESIGATAIDTPTGPGLRLEHGEWSLTTQQDDDALHVPKPVMPAHFNNTAPRSESETETLSPSDLGGAKALPGDGLDEETAKLFGTVVHALLEGQGEGARALADADLSAALKDEAKKQAQQVLSDQDLDWLFAGDVLAEVPITAPMGNARIHGTIDRLHVTPTTIHIVDFKTNRVVPTEPSQVPEGVLRQMGAYAHAIAQIYPDREIRLSILWTHTCTLMPIPHDIVTVALGRTQYLDDTVGGT
ncbi:double-strand break repair helicase AddA [Tateyamaria omphalii]|uniref:double-strand break repair helicase AddA n=1 Tax=Tateyamaria omphalii TaxID=299262 RepID=UPI001C98F7CA|nr:double-strand break repair helicase AddA [Tateyamaria omphalii]MBY5933420.1 double-strand break repair helicase AddA [Tateyamaria omphalii]